MNMKNIIKDALILFAITLIAGICLGAVHMITEEPIARVEEQAKQDAYRDVFENATEFKELDASVATADNYATILSDAGIEKDEISEVVAAFNGSEYAGLVVTVIAKDGYGGDIKFSVGIQKDGTLNGISILSISETAGLGMKAKEDKFQSNFRDKNADTYTVTKNGASKDGDVEAISGATITSKAVTKGVNSAVAVYNYFAKNGVKLEGGATVE
jgi:electron transport complex protein RnfG